MPANPANPVLLGLDPVPTLLRRVRSELSADFGDGEGGGGDAAIRISRAPGRLDVMGGIADYTGSLVCELPLDRAAAVALRPRDDRQVQVFSFNLYDEHKPFTLRISLDALAGGSIEDLRREFNEPGRKWAAYLAGCLFILHEQGLADLRDPRHAGVNLAVYSTVPLGAGISSSAAIEVATMINLLDHFAVRERVEPMRVASMCQQVENRVVGAPCGIMDQVTSCAGEAGTLLRLLCQPHQLQPALSIPAGVRFIGVNSNVKHSVGGGAYGRTRCAAFMAHKMILETMRRAGAAAGREMVADPMNGYLANLDPEDYKLHFRPRLPEFMRGSDFLRDFGGTIDTATAVLPEETYPVQHAADHHVLEARRVKNFVEYLQEAERESAPRRRGAALDRAGHLMYASHLSYTNDAMLGAEECDLLVKLVREREPQGLYGAKITGGGSGGTVAVLADDSEQATAAVAGIVDIYQQQTGRSAEVFTGTSDGAWRIGSTLT
jgi:L-arabinokinase